MNCPECTIELQGQDIPIGVIYPCGPCKIIVLKLSGEIGKGGISIVMGKEGGTFKTAPPLNRSLIDPIKDLEKWR